MTANVNKLAVLMKPDHLPPSRPVVRDGLALDRLALNQSDVQCVLKKVHDTIFASFVSTGHNRS